MTVLYEEVTIIKIPMAVFGVMLSELNGMVALFVSGPLLVLLVYLRC